MKKIISLILCVAMMCGALTAFAGFKDVEDNIAIETLEALGVIEGDEKGNFNPDSYITRAEACAIAVRVIADQIIVYPADRFEDVPYLTWYRAYVDTAYNMGIMQGYGEGKFVPMDNVTYDQMITIITNMLGYNVSYLAGIWPENVNRVAYAFDLYKNVTGKGANYATRADVAQMLYNALNVEMVSTEFFIPTGDTLLSKMGYSIDDAVMIDDDFDTFGHYTLTYKEGKKTIKTGIIISEEVMASYKNGYLTTADGDKIKVSSLDKDVEFYHNGEKSSTIWSKKNDYKIISLNGEIVNIVLWTISDNEIYNLTDEELEDMFTYIDLYDYEKNESVVTSYGEFAFISNDYEDFDVICDQWKKHDYLIADDFKFDYENYLTDEDAESVEYIRVYFDYLGNPVVIRFYDEDDERVIATESKNEYKIVEFNEDDFIR